MDRPRSKLPDQICNLSAAKHAGGLKVKSLLSSLPTPATAQYALSGLISPSSGQESLYGPLCKRPEPPRVPPPPLPSSPEGGDQTDRPGQVVMMLLACVHVHYCVTVITTVRVNAGFIHHFFALHTLGV